MSFAPVVPWASCGNEWNTPRCFDHFDDSVRNISSDGLNSSLPPGMVMINGTLMKVIDPVEEFWYNKVLQISSGVDDLGSLRWELVLCLILAWVICYFCIWKGVKSSGKAVYFTATFPYVILFILFIRGITLTGATKGIKYYLMPDFERLKEPDVWIEAGTQVFYSYTIALGALTALGSYNKFNNNCYKDCIIVALINSGTSFVSGFVVFSVLGFMRHEQDVDVGAVAESGPGLAFLAYPKAITQMPIAPLWAILFFFMLLLLGLGSEFVAVEGFVTAVVDSFPQTLRRGHRREALVACVVFVSFCIGLTMVTNGGLYVFYVWDYYASSGMTLLWFCFFECIAIGWLYGANKFYDDIELMVGFRINPWLRICWTYVTPVVTCAIFVFELVRYVPLKIEGSFFSYEYPMWAQSCGWCLALTSMSMVPIYAIYKLLSTPGTFRERWILTTTAKLKPHQMKENVTSAPCSQAELRDLLSAPEKPGEVSRISSLLPITNDKEDQ
ncbi:PREDICTED: sodium- and chloride-dependent taurine transporter-like [Priapulus caudatus]|uniref:Sodium- and chloride-dependent taurine transporter-like n=1 Tax=Priapulus caudatus TaxID=37621 RepID=A0ABM1EED7_PRICU|nr:PREDICTED: sodium- and chloride-dependent taurine transporter-like [Priapulus caudatus]